MKEFLADFFKRYGAAVEEGPEQLDVTLPMAEDAPPAAKELARRFGRERLSFVFDAHDAKAGIDLVAPGGHVLRTIDEFLATRGRRSYVVAPKTRKLEKALVVAAIAPKKTKTKLVLDERTDEEAWDAHFTFRLRYRGKERKDALLDVVVPVRPDRVLEPRAARPPGEAASWESHPRKRIPEERLREAFSKALGLVDELAAREAVELEARARARLEKDAARLEIFYDTAVVEQQTNRIATEVAQMKIEELEAERLLKRRELVESARVEAEAEPLQLLAVERPRRRVAVRVERVRGKEAAAEGQIELAFDLSTGEVDAPPCPACSKTLEAVSVCDAGHVVHETCAAPCASCEKVVCKTCGAAPCARGGEIVGPECAFLCDGCGERVCKEHLRACKVCSRDDVASGSAPPAPRRCTGCLHACAHCRGLACEAHRLGVATGDAEAAAFLCTECAVSCPGCGRPEPRSALSRCQVCGRLFCASCLPAKKGATACASCRSDAARTS